MVKNRDVGECAQNMEIHVSIIAMAIIIGNAMVSSQILDYKPDI